MKLILRILLRSLAVINRAKFHINCTLKDSFVMRKLEYAKWTKDDDARMSFYAGFVKEGSLVFDVGANFGNRVKSFLKLNGLVVGVEPQKKCIRFLQELERKYPGFILEPCALGDQEGSKELNLCQASTLSSLSNEWIDKTNVSGRFSRYNWIGKEWVKVKTLDQLISKYGRPDFIKIDVEGFELKVLEGLTVPVRALSFEYTPETSDIAIQCIYELRKLGTYQFQISFGELMAFYLPSWVAEEEIISILRAENPFDFGDIYALNETAELGLGMFKKAING